jgi:hypothetical protein
MAVMQMKPVCRLKNEQALGLMAIDQDGGREIGS